MRELVLQAGDDLVARLAHEGDPLRAVVELVWNALDGEARAVTVRLERGSDLGGITAVVVEDDGHGISPDEVQATFGRIGNSWKSRSSRRTKNGMRALHGRLGEGRLRAFALGSHVVWASRSVNTTGKLQEVTISGSRATRNLFGWDVADTEPQTRSGTVVTAHNEEQRSLAPLLGEDAIPTLRSHFAPVLLNEPGLTIRFDGVVLDPAQEILYDTYHDFTFGDGDACTGRLRVIEWKSGKHRAVYFGADEQHFVHEEAGSDIEGQYPYSAYVTWDGLDSERLGVIGLGDMAPEPVSDLLRAVRRTIRAHFADRRRERRREQVQDWKDAGVYPYEGDPATEPEQAERAVFDVVSGALAPAVSKRNRLGARLTLALLRDAIRNDPDKLAAILHEVVALSEEDRETLSRLLTETTLPAIIRSANLITSRGKFLAGLEHIIFDPEDSPAVGERDHLHRILERELWVFGEAYHMMNSERGLTELLRTHLRLEGLPARVVEPVRRWDGKSGRVDLHLAAKYQEHDRIRHLIVELKAPTITVGRKELDQIEDYADVIVSTPQCASSTAHWDLILVAGDFDRIVQNRISEDDLELGRVWGPTQKTGQPKVTAYVRRWRDIIDENRRRLNYITSTLEHDPSVAEGLGYIKGKYADLLPSALAEVAAQN
jgi:hypothetical protein